MEICGEIHHFPEWVHEPSPFESLIESRADWVRKVFRAPGILVDEYGDVCRDDLEWLKTMTGPSAEQRAKEESYEMRGPTPYPLLYEGGPRKGQPQEWRDPEGFRFADYEFS